MGLTPDYTIKQGDTIPILSANLEVDFEAVSLANATVQIVLVKRSEPTVPFFVGNAVIVNAVAGEVKYEWVDGDTDIPGSYFAEWVVTLSGGKKRRFPNVGFFTIHIHPSLPIPTP